MPQRSRRKQPKKGTGANATKDGAAGLNTRLTLVLSLLTRRVTILFGPTILASYALYVFFWKSRGQIPIETTWLDVPVLLLVFLPFLVAMVAMSQDIAVKLDRIQESARQKNLRYLVMINAIAIACATVVYSMLLRQGYLEGLAIFLRANVFPALSSGASYVISNIVGWALSGIVGGFLHDALKRLLAGRAQNKPDIPARQRSGRSTKG